MLFPVSHTARRFIVLALFLWSAAQGQQIKFEHYNENMGLSHNAVRHIVQDETGFLWVGTFSGLNRFDGYQFKWFMNNGEANSIKDNDITALELDKKNNRLWIGTRYGLSLLELDTEIFTTFLNDPENPQSLPDNEIRSLHVDDFDRIWVGTKTKGLYLLDLEENVFSKIEINGFDYIKELFQDGNGHIWVGSYDTGGVARISLAKDGSVSEILDHHLSIPSANVKNPYVNFIYEDHRAIIYVGTREGLFRFNAQKNSFEHLPIAEKEKAEKLGPHFLSVARAPNGKYWVGTLGGLLVCDTLEDIPSGKFDWHYTILSDDHSLAHDVIFALHFDPSGTLWIGTEDGLDKYDPFENQFRLNKGISIHIDNQVPRIRGFSRTTDKKLVVATRNNGLFVEEEGGFSKLKGTENDIASIFSEDGALFFCGLWNGQIMVYDYLKKTQTIADVGFDKAAVLSFLPIGEDRLLVGSFGEGALVLDRKTLRPVPGLAPILKGSAVNKMSAEKNGSKIWFATETGVHQHDLASGTTQSYRASAERTGGLPHDNVSDVLVDGQQRVWAATRSGMARFDVDLQDFVALGEPKEHVGQWVTDMLMDARGILWLNMNNNAIAKLYDAENGDTKVQLFNVNSGNRLEVFSASGFYHFEDSLIYLAGKNGVISFSPYTLTEELSSPKPFITEFKVHNKEVYTGIDINGQRFETQSLNSGGYMELDYINRNFSLQFSSPSYSNQRQNKYQYKLEGFQEDWIEVTSNSRTVQYTNLYPKEYRFRLRASNSNGYWSDEVVYRIKVNPPFWLTYKAFLLALVFVALLIYIAQRIVRERMKLRQQLLAEKLKRERNKKLNEEKLRFFTNISHELRTPLTLILGPAMDLMKQAAENRNDYMGSRSQLIHQNANRLLKLVNQVLDFRKAQTGALQLQVGQVDILQETKTIFESFKELAKQKNISFHFNCEQEELFGWIDREKYNSVLYNLLSNAIKFSTEHGTVDLFLGLGSEDKGELIIEVADDGIGIPESSQHNIFSRFYQARNSKESTTGSGIGLSLVKSLVECHKGEISFVSNAEKGTVFTVKLPITEEKYAVAEKTPPQLTETTKGELSFGARREQDKTTHIKERLLIIEDNVELRNYLVDYLSDFYRVYAVENGLQGLQTCRQVKPILCVCDVMTPVMDGISFCKTLKKDDSISHIPVILLTALSENSDKAKGYDAGADGYLVKPFDPSLLKTVIANIISTRKELKAKFSADSDSDIGLLTHAPVDEEFMEKVNQLIAENITDTELSSTFLATELGMSTSKLYRKIKELTDLAPNEFIRTVRLKKGAILLRSGRYNVSEVADMTGFNDPLYFSRCFRKQFGFPPSNLTKNQLKEM